MTQEQEEMIIQVKITNEELLEDIEQFREQAKRTGRTVPKAELARIALHNFFKAQD